MSTVEDRIRETFGYNPLIGFVFYKESGDRAGRKSRRKLDWYMEIYFEGKNYREHRVAWLIYYGSWPKNIIDHKNRDKRDNRMSNLRDVTHQANSLNQGPMLDTGQVKIKGRTYITPEKLEEKIEEERKRIHASVDRSMSKIYKGDG